MSAYAYQGSVSLALALKQVNAHLVAAAACPVLKNQGDLLPSRLRLEE
jgi:hypothetical protein